MSIQSPSPIAQPQGIKRWLAIPEIPRALPFLLFVGLGALQGKLFSGSEYWIYALKTVLVGGMLWALRGYLPEMKITFSWRAIGVGTGIAVLWIGIDGIVPTLIDIWNAGIETITGRTAAPSNPEPAWNPLAYFTEEPALGWAFVVLRVLGRSIVVPPLEEVFYRSFLYRSIATTKFYELPLGTWHPMAFVITVAAFGLAHPNQWLPAIVCGAAFQWLVISQRKLGDAILAHATTNLIISVHAIATDQWQFT